MSTQEILRLVFSFIGGGAVAAVVGWMQQAGVEKKRRRAEYLRDQLRNLYGPLDMLIRFNDRLVQLNKDVITAYRDEISGKAPSKEEVIKARTERMLQTIGVQNEYGQQMRENNEKLLELARDNWCFIDCEDMDDVLEFIGHILRLKTEMSEEKGKGLPWQVQMRMPEIRIWDPEFAKKIRARCEAKRDELRRLCK